MSKLRALDLFCCAGGAGMGLHRAGFEVVGVDIRPQPRYPFEFHQADALTFPTEGFDFIWASPPCQRFSDLAARNGNGTAWPDLIDATRCLLLSTNAVWVIENVDGAPVRRDLVLCGTMFPELRVLRHRVFETSFAIRQPPHGRRHPLVFTMDKRKAHYGCLNQDKAFLQVTGGGNCTLVNARAAMGIDWMSKAEINEAIPPAYSEFIGRAAIEHILSSRRAAA